MIQVRQSINDRKKDSDLTDGATAGVCECERESICMNGMNGDDDAD